MNAPGHMLRELAARQKLFSKAGWAMFAVLVLCLLAMSFDARTINGVSVWVKPAKFAASLLVWFWTLAWAWGVLDSGARMGRSARIILWGSLATGFFEQGWITLRAALGMPSHFAADPLGAVFYALMGLAALVLALLAALLGLLVLRRPDPAQPRPWWLAVGLGLLIGGVLAAFTGASISFVGTPHVGGSASDAGNLAPFFWSRDGGDLRIAHFIGVHAMQALPLLALAGAGASAVALGAAGWTALSLAAWLLAMSGTVLVP